MIRSERQAASRFPVAQASTLVAQAFRPATIAMALGALALAGRVGEAHKPITSPYTYNEDVFPILRDRCGRCHVAGGVAPMSLMTYKDAYPWGESIRTELIAGHMPPWSVRAGFGNIKNAHALTARELNTLLTWASGGNPVGNTEHTPQAVTPSRDWRLGTPDLILPQPADFTLAADATEKTVEFTLPTSTTEAKWIRAVDLLPGNPAVVRSATVTVNSGSLTDERRHGIAPERVLALWVPGEDPVPLDRGAAFRLPAGAELVVRVRYKKTWEYERLVMTDRSTVGVYFASPPATEVRALSLQPGVVAGNPETAGNEGQQLSFTHTIGEDVQAIALYPDAALADTTVRVTAVRPDGSRLEMIHFRPKPEWTRRYWFERPVALPRGTRLEVAAMSDAALVPPGSVPAPAKPVNRESVRLTLNVVSR